MKPICEIVAQEILPAARAFLAKKLIEDYKLSQKRVAKLMGLTQPAVSQYKRNLRGYKIEIFRSDPKLLNMMEIFAKKIAEGMSIEEQTQEFRNICRFMVKNGYVCSIHKKNDPSLENCKICMSGNCFD
jgi:hypothetical protein